MRIVLTGGGTGGHIYPAVAVGKHMVQNDPDTKLLYIGTPNGMESRVVPEHGIPFESIEITGFRRKLSFENVKTVIRFLKGAQRSKKLLLEFKPDAVVGTGGYVCGPVVYAAAKLGIPTFIHEQNAIPGLTNQFLSRYADHVGVSFPDAESHFPKAKQTSFTGNPCATNVLRAVSGRGLQSLGLPPGKQYALMVGGSRGARAFNEAIVEMAPMLDRLGSVHFVFVTGDIYYESTKKRIEETAPDALARLTLLPYVHNMAEVLRDSALVVSRSGASSLAEITALGLPSILIPSPNVTNNHQEANARSLVSGGAAEMVLERELSGASLIRKLEEMLKDPSRLSAMSDASSQLAVPDSASRIADVLIRMNARR
ncbi:undecaprenyldiphospho-muramoylpentapeptide beta-N-acetylglucosaminyltransferase [Paenibacillus sp. GCM10027627]|uniref:undecaprenyldiphospho-muramoylpentapeptide beta-N-acetylglucosaminyltransferase n=1 Tax=unclassified Paenibacillus TaxID=185978 RepID=UPI00363D55A8